MKTLLTLLVYFSALLSLVPFLRPRSQSVHVLLWFWKLLAGALAPLLALVGALGALWGLVRRDGKLAGAGLLGAGLAARFMGDLPDSSDEFDAAFGPGWQERLPASLQAAVLPRRWSPLAPRPGGATWQRDLVYGHSTASGAPLLADLWQPPAGVIPSGLGLVYVHGGGWRIGEKDMGMRPFFRRLAGQGHTILDIDYTLWPEATLRQMVAEVKQGVLWLKAHGPGLGVHPDRIVLCGGSAGGHLALLAAYTHNHPAFQPADDEGDASVCGVVAYYPPTDFAMLRDEQRATYEQAAARGEPGLLERAADTMLDLIFRLDDEDLPQGVRFRGFLLALLGGDADEVPDVYRLLSPMGHVSPACPPTLLLQGSDDVFLLAPQVRRLHRDLRQAGVPVVLLELPHAEHAFDLVLPRLSPLAQAATYDVERFLALLV
jgi:acetyl esterase/lipase